MLSSKISPLPSVRTSLNMFLKNLYVCSFIVTKIVEKLQFVKLTFSEMTFREISGLNNFLASSLWLNKLIWVRLGGKCLIPVFLRGDECVS